MRPHGLTIGVFASVDDAAFIPGRSSMLNLFRDPWRDADGDVQVNWRSFRTAFDHPAHAGNACPGCREPPERPGRDAAQASGNDDGGLPPVVGDEVRTTINLLHDMLMEGFKNSAGAGWRSSQPRFSRPGILLERGGWSAAKENAVQQIRRK